MRAGACRALERGVGVGEKRCSFCSFLPPTPLPLPFPTRPGDRKLFCIFVSCKRVVCKCWKHRCVFYLPHP